MSYDDPSYADDPTLCRRCGNDQFVTLREPGLTTTYCTLCAEPHQRDYDPIDRRCSSCRTIKKMSRQQFECDECKQRDRQAATAWNSFMGRD